MSTPTEICNIATSHLGVGKEIANLETENSQEAKACRRFYNLARQATLRDFPWPFAKTQSSLALVAESPTTEWLYSYRYPTGCAKLRRVLSALRNDNRQSRVPYKIGRDTTGRLIYCDETDAVLEYIFDEEDSERFTADFVLAFSFRLAAYIAPRLTSGDPFKMSERAMQLYIIELTNAQATALNEQQDEQSPESEFIRSRDDGDASDYRNRDNASSFP